MSKTSKTTTPPWVAADTEYGWAVKNAKTYEFFTCTTKAEAVRLAAQFNADIAMLKTFPKHLRLTHPQWRIIRKVATLALGMSETTQNLGRMLGYDDRYIANYLWPRLSAMLKRGFLVKQRTGSVTRWQLGPRCDELKERNLLAMDEPS